MSDQTTVPITTVPITAVPNNLLAGLNQPQSQAVSSDSTNLLVLAGAGSGKTRVLVHRIAWLIQHKHVPAHSILAVTFTNKAAKEMSHRIETLLDSPMRGMWVGTFHGLAHRLLRMHWQDLGLIENFQVLDSDDQKRLLKRLMKEMGVDEKELPVRDVQYFVNDCKDNGLRYSDLEKSYDMRHKIMHSLYQNYEQLCRRNSLVDFAELLLRAHELWLNHPHILEHYQERFRYILVDEFQDTNSIQYAWIKVLSSKQSNIMVVGDDDQSIYGWRGAKIEHIQQFEKDFQPAQVIRLEQNYRSTANILGAANAVIQNNTERLGKTLWTEDKQGKPVYVYQAFNEYDESEYIVEKIKQYQLQGIKREEIAVLYRSNAQSRIIEERLLQSSIPYRVYGGLRFFDRAEIRDALAYLRLVNSRHDDAAFERVINLPTRGIGQKTIEKFRQHARMFDLSLWASANELIEQNKIAGKAAGAIQAFIQMIDTQQQASNEINLFELLEALYHESGLKEYHAKENNERSRSKVENLDELLNALKQYESSYSPLDDDLMNQDTVSSNEQASTQIKLADFLSHAVLESSENQAEEWEDCVQLMTLHSAKGLEFNCVFLGGFEQGLFPHKMSMDDGNKLEEERRLCYVGITRAMKSLHLCYAVNRSIHGRTEYCRPSQFLSEIPEEFLQNIRQDSQETTSNNFSDNLSDSYSNNSFSSNRNSFKSSTKTPVAKKRTKFSQVESECGLAIGQNVTHKKFGEGVVIGLEGNAAKQRVQVKFKTAGTRWLLASVAKLV